MGILSTNSTVVRASTDVAQGSKADRAGAALATVSLLQRSAAAIP
jgi:hypothetical protein